MRWIEWRSSNSLRRAWLGLESITNCRDRLQLLSGFDWFFADFFFDSASPLTGQPESEHSVEQIGKEQHRWHPFVIQHGKNENKDDDKKTRDGFLRLPIHGLKARILKPAEHHEGKKEQQRR